MGEQWVSTRASASLSGRKSRDTAPEIELRRALHAKGARFRLHRRIGKTCVPDIVLPRHRVAVWVDGCYWHSCELHGRRTPFTGPNAALWEAKMNRTRARDAQASRTATELGWTVVRLWEHDILANASVAADRVLAACPK